jgi:predicted transcriptional regulator
MKAVMISARIPEDLNAELAMLAQALNRNRTWIVAEALRNYIASERQFLDAVQVGIDDWKTGRIVPHEQVMREMDELLAGHPEDSRA